MQTLRFVVVFLLWTVPAWAQDGGAVIAQLVDEGAFVRCEAGERKGCSLFARLVALRLNPTGSEGGWGWLTKQPGETQHEGFAEDAIVFTADTSHLRNVKDIIGGAGAAGARPAWPSEWRERRPSNRWAKPVPLSAEDLAYLGGSSGGGGGGGTGGGTDYAAQLARIEQQLASLAEILLGRYGSLLEQAAREAQKAAARGEDLQHRAEDLKNRVAALEARGWPLYSGSILIFGRPVPITLRPQE